MKKRFVRPQIQVEVIEDINEPVYMACSGFAATVSGYQHQGYETGKPDDRYQVNAQYYGAPYTGPLYMIATFECPVDFAGEVVGWEFVKYIDDQNSYTIVAKTRQDITLNGNGDKIGFGDFTVTLEDGLPEGSAAGSTPTILFTFSTDGCI